jgi:hypothetical protein
VVFLERWWSAGYPKSVWPMRWPRKLSIASSRNAVAYASPPGLSFGTDRTRTPLPEVACVSTSLTGYDRTISRWYDPMVHSDTRVSGWSRHEPRYIPGMATRSPLMVTEMSWGSSPGIGTARTRRFSVSYTWTGTVCDCCDAIVLLFLMEDTSFFLPHRSGQYVYYATGTCLTMRQGLLL